LATTGFGAFFTSLKNTFIRLLFLVVGMGLSITRDSLTFLEYILTTLLTLAYFVFDVAFEYIILQRDSGEVVSVALQWGADIGLFLTDVIFLAWITFATYTTMIELKAEQQTFKFGQYRTLIILILISLALSILLGIAQVIIESQGVQDSYFRWWWIWEMYWQLVYLAAVIAISVLWRPSSLNSQYTYSVQLTQGEGEFEPNEPKDDDKNIELETETPRSVELDKESEKNENKNKANISSDEDSYTSSSL